MASDVYGFPQSRTGYDIIRDYTQLYWKPALIDRGGHYDHPHTSGFKIHVSVLSRDADKLARAVLPVLQNGKFDHKVVYPLSEYEALCKTDQAGKFITIYPGPHRHISTELVRQLDPALRQLAQAGVMPGPTPMDRQQDHKVAETKLGNSGFLWYILTSSYFK
jgi:hypothetical protein